MIIWPRQALRPQQISIDLSPRNLRGPSASNGFVQVVSNSSGIWKAQFSGVPVYSSGLILLWRSIANAAEGMANTILIPAHECADRIPLVDPYGEIDIIHNGVPHDDESEFDDLTLYENQYTIVRSKQTASAGITKLQVEKEACGMLTSGQRFSIHDHLYEIKRVPFQNSTKATIEFLPTLRTFVTQSTKLEFDYPTLRVKLASDNEMFLPLNFGKQAFPPVNFIEDV